MHHPLPPHHSPPTVVDSRLRLEKGRESVPKTQNMYNVCVWYAGAGGRKGRDNVLNRGRSSRQTTTVGWMVGRSVSSLPTYPPRVSILNVCGVGGSSLLGVIYTFPKDVWFMIISTHASEGTTTTVALLLLLL